MYNDTVSLRWTFSCVATVNTFFGPIMLLCIFRVWRRLDLVLNVLHVWPLSLRCRSQRLSAPLVSPLVASHLS